MAMLCCSHRLQEQYSAERDSKCDTLDAAEREMPPWKIGAGCSRGFRLLYRGMSSSSEAFSFSSSLSDATTPFTMSRSRGRFCFAGTFGVTLVAAAGGGTRRGWRAAAAAEVTPGPLLAGAAAVVAGGWV